MEVTVLLGVGVAIAEPPVNVVYQSKFAPATIPPAESGDNVVLAQNVCTVVVGGAGRGFTVTAIAVLVVDSQLLAVSWLA